MSTPLRKATPGLYPVTADLGFTCSWAAHLSTVGPLAQLLVIESAGGVKRHGSEDLHRSLGGWALEMTLPPADHPLPRRQQELG